MDNPYPKGTVQHDAWNEGFAAAHKMPEPCPECKGQKNFFEGESYGTIPGTNVPFGSFHIRRCEACEGTGLKNGRLTVWN